MESERSRRAVPTLAQSEDVHVMGATEPTNGMVLAATIDYIKNMERDRDTTLDEMGLFVSNIVSSATIGASRLHTEEAVNQALPILSGSSSTTFIGTCVSPKHNIFCQERRLLRVQRHLQSKMLVRTRRVCTYDSRVATG
jgi:hypothetical protein